MGANSTSIAVGCAVGIPCFIALCVALVFFLKTRRRFQREDLEYSQDVNDMDKDLSYTNIDQLKLEKENNYNSNSEPSEDSDQSRQNHDGDEEVETKASQDQGSQKQPRYVPAYRRKFKSSVSNLNSSRNSSFSNLPNNGSTQKDGSNSSINSNTTNQTDMFYNNIPLMDQPNANKQAESTNNSLDLARSLQQPTPSYSKRPVTQRSSSVSSAGDDDYDLKNNYTVDNEDEIQEEDQYENEFTNYSENKRAYIDSLRPK
ncbi:hypothetical protein BN7_2552 [Wickerhamomyces ciferrii]|uniref:Uncharacterized protein n=1 Tax=Wickerhamomyces ciferrii (strain ATCC 14091 / BCRC 22168 / CBS 111 / JCM 3599 / NBRC 0793 / NRRL Y-1031 F-60-10) TaxID=1206466 RepID=K0KD26_WICCF|nr:uncharacterized protein BN7_2552 [Wickerhamomyces ciferrii]CCH43005.1 hypothetical protein BN7_2552 [Wickerhamomyces ciferrii]